MTHCSKAPHVSLILPFMQALAKSLDFIIDTASGDHPFDPYMSLLKTAGVLVLVGAPSEVKLSPLSLLLGKFSNFNTQEFLFFLGYKICQFNEPDSTDDFPGMKSISGSATGGTKQTQEMLDFCAAHKIYPNIEIVPIQYVNEALERLIKRDVKYRFVIDVESSLK